jgi:hypothetical protein
MVLGDWTHWSRLSFYTYDIYIHSKISVHILTFDVYLALLRTISLKRYKSNKT